ncbi:hypothetical protein NIES4103_11430 [Nostoc sp. NIES-4103]|nr:hypothetical protein NIES4103_11430 [Nostoc sp. NIES-4103]
MGVEVAYCTVVEDSVLGVRAGVSAGMKLLGYTDPSEASSLEDCGARECSTLCTNYLLYYYSIKKFLLTNTFVKKRE